MRQKLGQHFLTDASVSELIARELDPSEGDLILEVGPGHGELTQAILGATEERGVLAKVIAVERDPALAEELQKRFENDPSINIELGDILEFLQSEKWRDLVHGAGSYKIAGNIPYYLTGHLLRTISELEPKPKTAIFLIQKEVAERIVATAPDMNRLSAATQFWAEPKVLRAVGRKEFNPPPEVDSAVISLKPNPEYRAAEAAGFYKTLRAAFAQPRKTLFNNLRVGDRDEAKIKAALEKLGLKENARPQDLTLAKIKEVASELGDEL